jgi:hypothetical protein
MALVPQPPPDLLIVVFIHGQAAQIGLKSEYSKLISLRFKGTDSTFGPFPERLRHVLSETLDNVVVESIVFPAYEVRTLSCVR